MGKIKKYWSPVWGKVVDGISFIAKSERGGGMVVTSDDRVIRIIERSKAFRKGRVKMVEDVVAEGVGTQEENCRVASGEAASEDTAKVYEEVVSFQMARDVVMREMRERGEEVVMVKSKAEVKKEAARLGIEFPNLK